MGEAINFIRRAAMVIGAVVLLVLPLIGCGLTPQGDLVRAVVRDKGQVVADTGLDNALWFLCNGASVGAVQRWMAGSAERAAAWRRLCSDLALLDVVAPGGGVVLGGGIGEGPVP